MAEVLSSHRNSVAWQKGMTLTKLVYQLTKSFPSDERFGLTNQLRRASVSVPSNIAEGKGRSTTGELIQYLGFARGSLQEVDTQLELAILLGYGDVAAIREAQALVVEGLKILNATVVTLQAKVAAKKRR